jgi:hypothetical protein
MKRLCVFYRLAKQWENKPVNWIVCKECQKKIKQGKLVSLLFKAAAEAKIVEFLQ